jgi:hypothetical protein
MLCSLYQYDLKPMLQTKTKKEENMDVGEKLKQLQAEYYIRRGFFQAYKRKVAKKANVLSTELKSISTIEELDAYCFEKIKEREGVEIHHKSTVYFLRLCN